MTNKAALPERCMAVTAGKVLLITRGVQGYILIDHGGTDPVAFAEAWNNGRDVTASQAAAMKTGLMFGWDAPGADPAHYHESMARHLAYDV